MYVYRSQKIRWAMRFACRPAIFAIISVLYCECVCTCVCIISFASSFRWATVCVHVCLVPVHQNSTRGHTNNMLLMLNPHVKHLHSNSKSKNEMKHSLVKQERGKLSLCERGRKRAGVKDQNVKKKKRNTLKKPIILYPFVLIFLQFIRVFLLTLVYLHSHARTCSCYSRLCISSTLLTHSRLVISSSCVFSLSPLIFGWFLHANPTLFTSH